ncbi:hypothetical protein HYH03_015395 [Edaphochlamys debaryana]|uniref:Uncharacterized protein n=1 Tax=Edaphochlamys debaryana TaxID=47281 RepID=A0A836BR04_9CHLO|nr:hypothetical protein HYH03_015395 [Edaphochlamys debaryana]|eukprot:KAG2485951.1 hypothetical protein HYH03_015395 [Edaphochlamys debaryana]
MPVHVLGWKDKLNVQRWFDDAMAEITQNGTTPVDRNCDDKFGQGYINRWKASRKDVCTGGKSTFTCYEHPPHDHGSNIGSLFCTATNLVLAKTEDFLGDVLTKGARYPTPKKGSAQVACKLNVPWSRDQVADQHSDRWLHDALDEVPEAQLDAACSDPARTVDYPVYFVTRMDPTNAFHHFEEVVNFFSALLMYDDKELLKKQGITIVAFDGAPKGFFLELWRRIAYPYRIRFLRERPYPENTCFKQVLIAAMPHRSLYTHFWPGQRTGCRSAVMTGVITWAQELMSDARPEAYSWPDGQHRQNEATVVGRVTWVSRKHFETANRHSFTSWQAQRVIGNEDALVPRLAAAVQEWNSRSCLRNPGGGCRKEPVYFEFGTMELGDHRWYPDQLQILARTSVLMAVHGAGCFNEVWLRRSTSTMIEVLHNSAGNHHYANIAAMIGLPYIDMGSAHDPDTLAARLTQAMDETAVRMAAVHERKMAADKDAAAMLRGG